MFLFLAVYLWGLKSIYFYLIRKKKKILGGHLGFWGGHVGVLRGQRCFCKQWGLLSIYSKFHACITKWMIFSLICCTAMWLLSSAISVLWSVTYTFQNKFEQTLVSLMIWKILWGCFKVHVTHFHKIQVRQSFTGTCIKVNILCSWGNNNISMASKC